MFIFIYLFFIDVEMLIMILFVYYGIGEIFISLICFGEFF